MKNNKKSTITKIVLSTVITILPAIAALICQLFFKEYFVAKIGENAWKNTIPFSFILPAVLVLVNALCIYLTFKIEKKQLNDKMFPLVLSIVPFISLFTTVIVWSAVMNTKINMFLFMGISIGVLFAVIGNFMPKVSQNKALGIKIKWTLQNEENWNATHRVAGKVWFFAGLALIIASFLPEKLLLGAFFLILFIIIFVPISYSYAYYKKQVKNGTWSETPQKTANKKITIASTIATVIIVIFCIFALFTGEINVTLTEQTLTIEADFWSDAEIDISKIEKIELSGFIKGKRIAGFQSTKLSMGTFTSDDLGTHTRYAYTENRTVIIITCQNDVYVINTKTQSETLEIYEKLLALWEK